MMAVFFFCFISVNAGEIVMGLATANIIFMSYMIKRGLYYKL